MDACYDTALGISWLSDADVADEMSSYDAMSWAAALNVHGVTGWRLPSTDDSNPGSRPWGSEMTHMYDATLGNIEAFNPGYGLVNTGPFNIYNGTYWSSAKNSGGPPLERWAFMFFFGLVATPADLSYPFHAWAVHDGDIAPIPEPQTYALMLAGLGVIALSRWLRRE